MMPSSVIKPDLDNREYRLFEVSPCGLNVLVALDDKSDKSAAAMCINVGSQENPIEVQGLAHFLEHMLFMGTEKYPEENEYSDYLSQHGGHSNAFTSGLETNYFFDIQPQYLEGALDRFAQFFISPLLKRDGVERELKSVDSEFKKNLQSDMRRYTQILKAHCKPGHPYSKFDSGNSISLSEELKGKDIDIIGALRNFFNTHYKIPNMALVVLAGTLNVPSKDDRWPADGGRKILSLDDLQSLVQETFSGLPNEPNLLPDVSSQPDLPFGDDLPGNLILVEPLRDIRMVILKFQLFPQRQYWKSKPLHYLSHLIGHESEGSILSYLKSKGWATNLSAGEVAEGRQFSIFAISVELTEEGIKNYDSVMMAIFQFINLIRGSGIQEWIFKECQKLADISFRFKEKTSCSTFVSRTASNMHEYPNNYSIAGPSVILDFEPQIIKEIVKSFTVDNLVTILVSKRPNQIGYEGFSKVEKWYRTKYSLANFREKMSKIYEESHQANSFLHLPRKNPFIPESFGIAEMLESPSNHPRLVLSDDWINLWHKQDCTFKVPKIDFWLILRSPVAYRNPEQSVLCKLYVELMKYQLNEYSYMAEVAGLGFSMDVDIEGIQILFTGYDNKMEELVLKVLQNLKNMEDCAKHLDIWKDKLRRSYLSWSQNQAYQHASYYTTYTLQEQLWTPSQKLKVLDKIDAATLEKFVSEFFQKIQVECFVIGNASVDRALKFGKIMRGVICSEDACESYKDRAPVKAHLLPEGKLVHLRPSPNSSTPNSSLEYYLEICGPRDAEKRSMLILLANMMQEPVFNQLRTKEQLGYIVWASPRNTAGIAGLKVVVQSERDSVYLENRIESFLVDYSSELSNMSAEDFAAFVESTCLLVGQKDESLRKESSRWWQHIHGGFYEFDRIEKIIESLQKVNHRSLVDFYDSHVNPKSKKVKKLSIHIRSLKRHSNTRETEIFVNNDLKLDPDSESTLRSIQKYLRSELSLFISDCECLLAINSEISAPGSASISWDGQRLSLISNDPSENFDLGLICSKIHERVSSSVFESASEDSQSSVMKAESAETKDKDIVYKGRLLTLDKNQVVIDDLQDLKKSLKLNDGSFPLNTSFLTPYSKL